MKDAKSRKFCWGDQSVIGSVFSQGGMQIRLFSRKVVNFEHCVRKQGKTSAVHFSGSPKAREMGSDSSADVAAQQVHAKELQEVQAPEPTSLQVAEVPQAPGGEIATAF